MMPPMPIRNQISNQDTSEAKVKTRLTLSYFHHASSFKLVYKTLSQSFDETALKYSDDECFIFKSRQIID